MLFKDNNKKSIYITCLTGLFLIVLISKPSSVDAYESGREIVFTPGLRLPRKNTVTITDIDCNKIRYDENEEASCVATFVNTSRVQRCGEAVAILHTDLDILREVGRIELCLAPGEKKQWKFSFNVGSETYGRGIEVKYIENGKELDTWQEFFSVASEWLRVQMHIYSQDPWDLYFNQLHQFASEPTDFGEQPVNVEQYINGQSGYVRNYPNRRRLFAKMHKMGIKCTVYQNFAPCGPAGWEVVRRHPEFVLYDANGQPAIDPIYHAGQPNPMQLASPIEVGPKRKVTKEYLNQKYVPWQRAIINTANIDTIVYEANELKKYSEFLGFDGVYVDGNWGVRAGFGYDGKPTVPSGRDEDYARLNARNHRVYSEILKKENPNFGTWFNWSKKSVQWTRSQGWKIMLGSGVEGDVSDEAIRAVTAWKNVTFLSEAQTFLYSKGDSDHCIPKKCIEWLLEERDYLVQKYGANVVVGYISVTPFSSKGAPPGKSKWGWATINYFGAQAIATQVHLAGWYSPAWRPTTQFLTRYSRLIWARDIKLVPKSERYVKVSAPEKIFWKRLVYKRKTKTGYDLIIHLVRIPPMKKWDIKWPIEPNPLKRVVVKIMLQNGHVQRALALRPFHFEEPQQPVRSRIDVKRQGNKAILKIPPWRYYTMVVVRVCS